MNAENARRQNTLSARKKIVLRFIICAALLVIAFNTVLLRPRYEIWCFFNDGYTLPELYEDVYADGQIIKSEAIFTDSCLTGCDLMVCRALTVQEIIDLAEKEYGCGFTAESVSERSRFRTICVLVSEDGSIRMTCTSEILRWFADGGSWKGFYRLTSDDYENRIREKYEPMLAY